MCIKTIKFNTKIFFCLALVTIAAGCDDGKKTDLNSLKPIAKVNGDEITFNQFDKEFKSAKLTNETDPQVRAQFLSKMIDRQLLAQETIKLNLDRMPEVIDAVNSAKAQIYAQAYLAKKLGKLSAPDDREIAEYIENHPETFAHRKVFSTIDVIFPYDPVAFQMQSLQASVSDMKSLQAALDEHNIKYNMVNGNFSLDALPTVWADKLKQVKVGDLLFTHDKTKVIVKSISDISEAPMPDDGAKSYASKALYELKQQQFLNNEIARLRKLSQISTFDDKSESVNSTSIN